MEKGQRKKKDIWQPTKPQKRLLQGLLNPQYKHLNVLDLCKACGVARNTYYIAFRNERFVALYHEQSMQLIREAVAPIINASIREAKCGNHPHTKMLLEMANLHQDSLALTGKDGGAIVTADMPAKDAAKLYAQLVKGEK